MLELLNFLKEVLKILFCAVLTVYNLRLIEYILKL